jgi:hypothetical protein
VSVCCGDFCWGLLLLLLFLFFFFKLVFNIASLRTWFRGDVSNQNFSNGFLLKFYFNMKCLSFHAGSRSRNVRDFVLTTSPPSPPSPCLQPSF